MQENDEFWEDYHALLPVRIIVKNTITLLVSFFLVSCSASIAEIELKTGNGVVNLVEQVHGNWIEVCILTPYPCGAKGEEITGINRSTIHATGIGSSDSFNILAFVY